MSTVQCILRDEEFKTYETVRTDAKKFAKELLTACRELANDPSTVSIS
jgi:hypothetical protein